MNIVQTFYDRMADQYDKLFADWHAATQEQALLLQQLFQEKGFDLQAHILDCACGIGTQAIGLAALGYDMTASDISPVEIEEARKRAAERNVQLRFARSDFRALSNVFAETFDIIIAMDNALPHMLKSEELNLAIESITDRLAKNGLFVASIRDYDALLRDKPPYSPPYIHPTDKGRRVSFQTWDWEDDRYRLVQYIIDDEETPQISKFSCEYRATTRKELTDLLFAHGCREVIWKFPEETGFYQPIVLARKP